MTTIRSISCALPEREVTNSDIQRDNPSWDMARVAGRTGVVSRRIAAADETAYDLSVRACDALVAESSVDLAAVDAVICCTQTPDYVMPGNAHLLHRHLGLGDDVLAFDYNLGCSGYVYGLALADAFVRGGFASEILLVTADTLLKLVNSGDRSARSLLGDGAAATHVSSEGVGGTIVAAKLCSHRQALESFYVPAGGARVPRSPETSEESEDRHGNVRSADDIHMDGMGVWAFVNSTIPQHLREFLAERSLTIDDIDLCVFHQASKMTLDSLVKSLGVGSEKLYANMADVGNLTSASIPFALRAALDERAVVPGDRVLLSGYGVGGSYGSVLVDF